MWIIKSEKADPYLKQIGFLIFISANQSEYRKYFTILTNLGSALPSFKMSWL